MTSRLRAALVLGVIAAAEVVAAPAFASTSGGSSDTGVGLTVIQTILLYVVTPIVIFGIITLLVVGPSLARATTTEDKSGAHHPVLGESPRPAAAPDRPTS